MSYRLDVLKEGYVNSRFGICCPDCEFEENKTAHILCNMDDYFRIMEATGCFPECCLNIYTTNNTFQDFLGYSSEVPETLEITNIGDNVLARTTGETGCVNNNFYNCITQISGLCSNFSVFVNIGIFEVGTLSGTSAICILKDYIIDNSLTPSEAQDLLTIFFTAPSDESGMVTICNDTQIVIAACETFIHYAEAVEIFCDMAAIP